MLKSVSSSLLTLAGVRIEILHLLHVTVRMTPPEMHHRASRPDRLETFTNAPVSP